MKQILITCFAIFIISALAICQTNISPGINPYPKTITVTGSASMDIIPDEIFVQVDLREYEKKGSGKTDIEKIRTRFLESCKSLGIPDSLISVVSYQGMDRLYWLYKKRKAPDMTASISYQIKCSSTKLIEDFIEKLDDEATQNFFIAKRSHSNMEEYRKQLKIQAVKAAKEKADYLANAIGERVGETISIHEPTEAVDVLYENRLLTSNTRMQQPNIDYEATRDESGVDFKKIKIKFEVNAVFAIK